MARTLQGCHSYTLVKPGAGEKVTVKRGQSIDHLEKADQAYLKRVTLSPASVDDSHIISTRAPIFQETMDEDVKGQAQTEPFTLAVGGQGGGSQARAAEPVQVQVVVQPKAGVSATASITDADGDAAGDEDDDGADADEADAGDDAAAPAAPAKATATAKRTSKARKSA